MPATLGAAISVIFLSAISLLAMVAIAIAALVGTSRREDRLSPATPDVGAPSTRHDHFDLDFKFCVVLNR